MANIEELHLTGGRVVDGFLLPDPDEADVNGKLLPPLRRIRLEDLHEDDWTPPATLHHPSNFWRPEGLTRYLWGMPSHSQVCVEGNRGIGRGICS